MLGCIFWIWIGLAIMVSIFCLIVFSLMIVSGRQAQYEEDKYGIRRS